MVQAAILMVFPLCLAVAAVSDLLTMTIPNRVSAILLASFLIVAPLAGLSPQGLALHLMAGLVVFSVCFSLFAMNVMGGGDAKLLTAAAVWFGWNQALMLFVVYVGFIGGAVTLLVLMIRARADTVMAMGIRLPDSLCSAKKIPYGVAIGIAGFLAFPNSPLVTAVLGH